MTPQQIEALKLALEALKNNKRTHLYCEDIWYSCPKHEDGCANEAEGDECNCGADDVNAQFDQAITALEEALAQPEQIPPSADSNTHQPERHELQAKGEHPAPCARHCEANAFKIVIKNLKAQLAQRTWVGLSDEERKDIELGIEVFGTSVEDVLKEAEAKLKEKNT